MYFYVHGSVGIDSRLGVRSEITVIRPELRVTSSQIARSAQCIMCMCELLHVIHICCRAGTMSVELLFAHFLLQLLCRQSVGPCGNGHGWCAHGMCWPAGDVRLKVDFARAITTSSVSQECENMCTYW